MPKTYTPAIKFANRSAALRKMAQTVEQSQHFPSDKTLLERDYSGVIRKKRGSKWPIAISTLFNPVPAYCNPPSASPAVSTEIVITGSNFTPGCKVYIDGQLASGISCSNEHILYATVPPHVPSNEEDFNVMIKIVREDGRVGSSNKIFRYELAPTVLSVVPVSGYVDQNNFISVVGQNLKPLSTVEFSFGTSSYSNLATWKSPSLIETTSPIVPVTGVYGVTVISNLGVPSSTTGSYTYEWREPVLTSLINDALTTTGSTDEPSPFTITGNFFRSGIIIAQQEPSGSGTPTWGGSSWTFPADWVELTATQIISATSIRFSSSLPVASASNGGTRTIKVFNDDGKTSANTLPIYYQVGLPSVTSFAPLDVSFGDIVGVTGNHYETPAPVTLVKLFDTNNVDSFTLITSSRTQTNFEFSVPVGVIPLHTYKIYVSGTNGANISTGVLTARAMPSITSITPSTGGIAGYEVAIIGSGFSQADTIFTVDSQPVISYAVMTSNSASVTLPSHSVGTAYVTATNYANPIFAATASVSYVTASSINSGSNSVPVNG
jgi:hypothetical protein